MLAVGIRFILEWIEMNDGIIIGLGYWDILDWLG